MSDMGVNFTAAAEVVLPADAATGPAHSYALMVKPQHERAAADSLDGGMRRHRAVLV